MLSKLHLLLLVAACSLSLTTNASAQGFFQQLGNGIRDEVQNGIRREIGNTFGGQPQQPPPTNNPPPVKGFRSLPSEGGNKNIPSPGFGGGDEFVISPGPTQGGGNPIYTRPRNPQPNTGQPYYTEYQQPTQGYVDPQYVQPGSVNGPTYQYGQPTYVNSTPTSSAGDVPAAPVDVANYISVYCPGSVHGSCPYTLMSSRGQYAYRISGGQEQRFRTTNDWKIRFNDGGSMKTYRLTRGKHYRLKQDGTKWRLFVSE